MISKLKFNNKSSYSREKCPVHKPIAIVVHIQVFSRLEQGQLSYGKSFFDLVMKIISSV
jgi:hypothetical protein